jgi:2-polyprenyl-3-methyl-5-hydroxy-6-metoxy-1,4-benzoquinol methylase
LKVLVAIANYGTGNEQYFRRVLEEYQGMEWETHIVVLSNIPKILGPDVEVVVGLPDRNPWSLPFAYKQVFFDRRNDYDLFIYSEDDNLITQRHIEAFLAASEILPEDQVAGFLRYEQDGDGNRYVSSVHHHFHWDPGSVETHGNHTFAYFSNEHAGSFILTQKQLARAIASGGFMARPREGRYGMLETAATDAYTQCGLRKMICISHLEDFLIPHLPNKYLGRMGLELCEVKRQISALMEIAKGARPRTKLMEVETRVLHGRWSKSYYEPVSHALLSAIPETAKTVLSLGCGWGANEAELISQGKEVVAVPLDSVVAATAEAKGVQMVYDDFAGARKQLDGQRFDCLLISNILHLLEDPTGILASFSELLSERGSVVIQTPNFSYLPTVWFEFKSEPQFRHARAYESSGMHVTNMGIICDWFRRAGLTFEKVVWSKPVRNLGSTQLGLLPRCWQSMRQRFWAFAPRLLAIEFLAIGKRPGNSKSIGRNVGR